MPDLLDTYLENRWFVQPDQANNLDTAHGGHVLKWMDELGAMCSMRFCGETCVTARLDEVNFRRPLPIGAIAVVKSYVYETGETSIRIRTRVFREDPESGEEKLTAESYMVFVAIDEDRNPVAVPEVTVSSDRGQELLDVALENEP
ncbi:MULTISPECIES: acyl-CoA thioesterase [Halopenitus]|uniref:Acyl-CoA hydrolase n=1 Tax=Halopenitus malekzadehii TaxID=1267564 RepID=A0A1H6IDS6_9EURY|nr:MULTISPECIES: acyl-CoA thioesterase [Halopenitus]SEH46978.1 Acyl-CoA hydrolase [Halopenitus malekzadehii]